ncbi:MAG: cupin domain-containing protein [Campylobacteraceae bacterium]|nr:cupin domain-containing protein [Campylobacteraceae bacterium]
MNKNIFNLPKALTEKEEQVTLLSHPSAKICKIISPPNFISEVFSQVTDEWLSLVQGEATLEVDEKEVHLSAGDTFFIAAKVPHKIKTTSSSPLAIWLTVYLA